MKDSDLKYIDVIDGSHTKYWADSINSFVKLFGHVSNVRDWC